LRGKKSEKFNLALRAQRKKGEKPPQLRRRGRRGQKSFYNFSGVERGKEEEKGFSFLCQEKSEGRQDRGASRGGWRKGRGKKGGEKEVGVSRPFNFSFLAWWERGGKKGQDFHFRSQRSSAGGGGGKERKERTAISFHSHH